MSKDPAGCYLIHLSPSIEREARETADNSGRSMRAIVASNAGSLYWRDAFISMIEFPD
jgi:hypothetical protein